MHMTKILSVLLLTALFPQSALGAEVAPVAKERPRTTVREDTGSLVLPLSDRQRANMESARQAGGKGATAQSPVPPNFIRPIPGVPAGQAAPQLGSPASGVPVTVTASGTTVTAPGVPGSAPVTKVDSAAPMLVLDKPRPQTEGEKSQIDEFKDVVEKGHKQVMSPNKRQYAELSRNYLNRITCPGQIEKLIIPQDKGIEAEITNDNHDLFLRVGDSPHKQFPVDMSLICDGTVYLINAVVHPGVPSQEIVLSLPAGMRPISTAIKEKYKESMDKAAALPLEEKMSRIVQRVYKGDLLPYWQEVESPVSQVRWNRGNYSVFLQRVVKTEIDGIVAWDFVFRGAFPSHSFYEELRKVVKGDLIAFGKVEYEGHRAARVIVLTREEKAETGGGNEQAR